MCFSAVASETIGSEVSTQPDAHEDDRASTPPPMPRPETKQTPTKAKLRKLLNNYRTRVYRLKQKLKKTQIRSDKSDASKLRYLHKTIAEFVEGPKLDIIMSQIKNAKKKSCAKRWTYRDKSFALSLLHSSPKTYRMLRNVLELPSPKTLKKLMRNVAVYPGFNRHILRALKQKTANTPQSNRIASLVIDEMSIKEGVSYDNGRDVIEGFEETPERGQHLANHAIVFMVRGIREKWKQPVGYFLTSGPMSGEKMHSLIIECITKLKEVGITVVLLVADQGSNNRNLFQKHLNVTNDQPYFFHDEQKVFTMYDPPHLIKSVRNNFKKHGFEIEGNNVLWSHVRDFFDKDRSAPIRMAPKLTKKHIDVPAFTPLRVKLATQVLSNSVAVGVGVLAQWGIISPDAKHTADFIGKMNELFDCFNSMTITSSKPWAHAISGKSKHKEKLLSLLEFVKSIKPKELNEEEQDGETGENAKKRKKRGKKNLPCLDGWQLSITALLLLWEELSSVYDLSFLLTNRLNQDCLENFIFNYQSKGWPKGQSQLCAIPSCI